MKKKRVLILCTGNSCRSQMAEGVLRHCAGEKIEVVSAGSRPAKLNPVAVKVMEEIGIDIASHRSKHMDEFRGQRFDLVITVCDDVRETCPVFPGGLKQLHWSFPDPPHNERVTEKVIEEFRHIRDMIYLKFKHFADQERADAPHNP